MYNIPYTYNVKLTFENEESTMPMHRHRCFILAHTCYSAKPSGPLNGNVIPQMPSHIQGILLSNSSDSFNRLETYSTITESSNND